MRLAIAAAVAALAWCVVVPALVARQVRCAFRDAGFPSARFELADVGIGRVQLHDVVLADGLALGDIELDGSVSLLAGGHGPGKATIRGARVTADALARLFAGGGGGGKPLHVPELRIEDAVIATPAGPVALDGTVSLPPHGPVALDARARLATWRLGPLAAHDVELTAHDAAGALRVCARATVAGAAVGACASVPAALGALRELHALDVEATARADAWSVSARAHVAWGDGRPRVSGGHVHAVLPALAAGGLATGAIAIDADVAGPLSPVALVVGGRVHTERVVARAGAATATLRAVVVPFAVHVTAPGGALTVSSPAAIVASAGGGALAIGGHAITLDAPRVVLRDAGAAPIVVGHGAPPWPARLSWSAADATIGGVHVARPVGVVDLRGGTQSIAWRAIDGAVPVPIGAGELRFAVDRHGPRVLGGHADVLGGELTFAPARGPARGVVVRARNVDLTPLLALIARGRVSGTGRLDGALVLALDGGRPSLTSFTLSARGRGTLRVTDRDWQVRAVVHIPSLAIHRRVAAALADFAYAQLTVALAPPGADPELRLALHGRGRVVDQEIDLAIAFHNVRTSLGALR